MERYGLILMKDKTEMKIIIQHIKKITGIISLLQLCFLPVYAQEKIQTDICIYGGNSAGVIAAYTAAKLNKKVVLIEPGKRLGGLTAGGLGHTDIGNKYAITGLSKDFYRRIGKHYAKLEQWVFEPKVALAVFMDYVKEGGFAVKYNTRIKGVNKKKSAIENIIIENANDTSITAIVYAKQFIDCTYEGDLMAMAGVNYTIGREANSMYSETVNGVQLREQHQFIDGIDPYKEEGKPESGLLWGISDNKLAAMGSGDKYIQSYNFRICLSDDPANRIAIARPDNYDASKYELLLRYLKAVPAKSLKAFLKMDLMPNHKTDINNFGPFSTDMIGMNYQYPDGDCEVRKTIFKQHEDYTKGLLYFIGHDERMPEHLRTAMLQWGYPKDEYVDNNHWTPQLYIREARRMISDYVMTEANCTGKEVVTDGVGMAAYMMDSHNAQRIVVNGMIKNEGDIQYKNVRPYPIAYRSIIPKEKECSNLLVPVCLSASHIAYGSIRMEPVFMVLAQSAAMAVCSAIDKKTSVQGVDVKALQEKLTVNPYLDNRASEIIVDNEDENFFKATGNWISRKEEGYALSYLIDATASNSIAKFNPNISSESNYQVFIYYPRIRNASFSNHIDVFNGKEITTQVFKYNEANFSRGDWVPLGTYHFSKGRNNYVKVWADDKEIVVADAVLLLPVGPQVK